MKKEEEIKIDNLIEGVIYVAVSLRGNEYIFTCENKDKPFNKYVNHTHKLIGNSTGDINVKFNNFDQKYRMALPNEKEIYLLSMKEGKYTEPSIAFVKLIYQIY